MNEQFFASLNTLKANSFILLIAKLFGTKTTHTDEFGIVTIYKFRGTSYVTDYKAR